MMTYELFEKVLEDEITKTERYIKEMRSKKSLDVKDIILPEKLKCYIEGIKYSLDTLYHVREHYEKLNDSRY
jgi:hypothetical protein